MRGLGYLEDLADPRDKKIDTDLPLGGTAPEVADELDRYVFSILDQGQSQACVGFSTGQGLRVRWGKRASTQSPVAVEQPSSAFIWWLARQTHNAEERNAPTYIREAFKRIRAVGIAPESECSSRNLDWNFADKPTPAAFRAAFDRKSPTAYYRIVNGDADFFVDQFKRAIASGFPIVFGTSIPRSFFDWSGPKPYDDLDLNVEGGHAMLATSYDRDGVRGPNSWGRNWGNNGWHFFSWRFVGARFRDCWAVDAPPMKVKS